MNDFKQKLLSLGSTVEVLQPESFRKEIAEELKNTLKQYTCGR